MENKKPDNPTIQQGWTLRDEFANSAMQGILSNNELKPLQPNYYTELAYQIADAMLNQRELNQ